MDVRLLGKKNEGEGLGVAVLVDSAFAELKDKSDEQLAEAQRFLIDFGVRTFSWTAPRRIQASCGTPSGSATRGTS